MKNRISLRRRNFLSEKELELFLRVSNDFIKQNLVYENKFRFPEKIPMAKRWHWSAGEFYSYFEMKIKDYEKFDWVKPLLTVVELAKYLKVSDTTVRRLYRSGQIGFHKLGKLVRFTQDDIDDYLSRKRVKELERQKLALRQ